MASPARRSFLALSLAALALAACSSVQVEVQETSADLSAYRTYAWSPPPAAGGEVDAALAGELRRAVERELVERGLSEVSSTDADLLVRTEVEVRTRVATRHAYNTGFYTADRFEDGTLAVQLVEAASKAPVWSASAERKLRREAQGYGLYQLEWVPTGDEREWRAAELVEALFERFPLARVTPADG